MASMDENKTRLSKDYHDTLKPHDQTASPFARVKKEARPDDDGALVPVFEKSATALKLKPKLLKCKRTIQITTFNVRTLNRIG